MGFLDKAKNAVSSNRHRVTDLVGKHGDKIDQGLHKAADFADKKTGGKHTDKIAQGQQRVRGALNNLDDRPGSSGPEGTPPPPQPPPGPDTPPPPMPDTPPPPPPPGPRDV